MYNLINTHTDTQTHTGTGTGTEVGTRERTQDGNGDESGGRNESSSGDGNGDEDGNRDGEEDGIWGGGEETKKREARETAQKLYTRSDTFIPHTSSRQTGGALESTRQLRFQGLVPIYAHRTEGGTGSEGRD